MFNKIAVIGIPYFRDRHLQALKKLANEVVVFENEPAGEKEVLEQASGADAVICKWAHITTAVMGANPLKYVGVSATGYNYVDVEECKRKGVAVTNVPGYAREAVAELVFAQVLCMARKLREADKFVRGGGAEKEWFGFIGFELKGKTLGIIGLGQIGSRIAEIGQAFGMRVVHNSVNEAKSYHFLPLEELLKESDIISLNIPLTQNTRGMVGEKELALMKKGAILVNTARGAVVDEKALLAALKENRVSACLDVYWGDRPPKEFLGLPNVLFTPHTGWASRDALDNLSDETIANLEAFVRGDLRNRVA